MDEKRKVAVLAGVILVAIGILIGAYILFLSGGKKSAPIPKPPESVAAKETMGAENIPVFPVTSLDGSDELIRKLAKELSSHASLDAWLQTKDLIRKFTAAVDNIASGESPVKQIDFFKPGGPFTVYKVGPKEYIDPKSYDRYNLPTSVFVSFDPVESVRFYKGLKPLFQDAYKELGYPDRDFDQTLKKAVLELLETPVVDGDIRVKIKVKTYALADPHLEDLSDAQKSFLRMGPANVEAIQIKLREMARALGIPAERIPPPRVYTAK
jgi:hypothetical protein